MNIHHLELFYYVAKHGGISEAARRMPYGIQQPAISGQVAQLEEYLGVTLFQRRPFTLTPAGEKLFLFIEPFFSRLAAVASEIQGGTTRQIRIGASEIVLRDYLPELLQSVRKQRPDLRVALRVGYRPELESWLQKDELDLAVTLVEKKAAPGIHSLALLELPLVLLAPKNHRLTDAEELWKQDRIQETLICLPAAEAICKNFQTGLTRLGVDWFPGIEVGSLDLVETYVANGFGLGLSVSVPKPRTSPGVRLLELWGFAPVVLGVLWRGKPSRLVQTFIDEVQTRANQLR